MKNVLKKLSLLTLSAMTLASVAPYSVAFAQETATQTSESESGLVEKESKYLVALKKAVKAFEAEYPEAKVSSIKIEPIEKEESGSEEEESEAATSSVAGAVESAEEAASEAVETAETAGSELGVSLAGPSDESLEPYKLVIEGKDAQTEEEFEFAYDLSKGQLLEEEVESGASADEEVESSEEAGAEAAPTTVATPAADPAATTVAPATPATGAESEAEVLDLKLLEDFDKVKELAEEQAGYPEARKFELAISPETKAAEWKVTVIEDKEKPEAGRQATITIDAKKLEVVKVEGDAKPLETAGQAPAAGTATPAPSSPAQGEAESEETPEGSEGAETSGEATTVEGETTTAPEGETTVAETTEEAAQ